MIQSCFPKSKNQIDTLVRTVHVFTDHSIQSGMKKCGILTMQRGTVVKRHEIKLPNSEVMREDEKERYKYLSIVELDKIKENKMNKKQSRNISEDFD